LAAMLVGQTLNDNSYMPIYGCYVNGRDWYFMVLIDKEFSISQDFSATTDAIFKIFTILKGLKEIVKQRTL
jgi:hypothetical protein